MDVTLLPFLALEQHTTFPFFQGHGWSILHQSFAWWVASSNYVDPKTVLDNVKNTNQITIWEYIWLLGKIQWLIGYQTSLIVIARQPKYHRFYALVGHLWMGPSIEHYAFYRAGHLVRHLKTHSGEKSNKRNQYDFAMHFLHLFDFSPLCFFKCVLKAHT